MHALNRHSSFPAEILAAPVWCVAGLDDHGKTKLPVNPYTRDYASVTDANTWGTFQDACATAADMGLFLPDGYTPAVGHVLRIEDGIFVADFDKCSASAQTWRTQCEVLDLFESYTEESQSGNGMHTYARGFLYKGKRFKAANIEMYGHARFIVATGLAIDPRPMVDHSLTLAHFIAEHAPAESQFIYNESAPYHAEAVERLMANGFIADAFFRPGGYSDWGMYNRSDADHAFMKEILRVTINHKQALEIFSASPMGQRDKWQKRKDYRDWTLENAALEVESNKREEDRIANALLQHLPQVDAVPDVSLVIAKAEEQVKEVIEQQAVMRNYLPPEYAVRVPMSRMYMGLTEPLPVSQQLLGLQVYETNYATYTPGVWDTFEFGAVRDEYEHIPLPGFLGEFAQEISRHMHRPSIKIAEMVSLVVAQQIIGRGALVGGTTAVNLFLNLVGPSGMGKSVAKSLVSDVLMKVQTMYDLPDFGINDLPKSREGLHSTVLSSPTGEITVHIDESQAFMREMQNTYKGVSIAAGTGTLLTDLYSLADSKGMLQRKGASKAENSLGDIKRPFVSLLMYGLHDETLASLNGSLLKNGFAARVMMIHIRNHEIAARLNRNLHKEKGYKREHLERLGAVARFFDKFNTEDAEPFAIEMPEHVYEKHANFADWIHIRVTEESKAHYNRAAVNALKLAAIAAVFNDPKACVVTEELYDWACLFVLSTLNYYEVAEEAGELGSAHDGRRQVIIQKLTDYYIRYPTPSMRAMQVQQMGLLPGIADAGMVPFAWLTSQVAGHSTFKTDFLSPSKLCADVLRTMDGEGLLEFYHKDLTNAYTLRKSTGEVTLVKAALINAKNIVEMEVVRRTSKKKPKTEEK